LSDKAERKKKLIRDTAREVFIRKGFNDVTMKDIAQTAGISRGGLYLYYSSTEEL
jgi:AcrR family transcriptional regulator